MRPTHARYFVLLILLSWLAACDELPDADETLDEDVVITLRDPAADFASFQTFALSEVRAAKVDVLGQVSDEALDGPTAESALRHVSALLSARGYRQVEPAQAPELGLHVGAVEGTRTVSISNQYWGPSYGGSWGYPGAGIYYPFSFNYAYRTGVISLTLLDLRAPPGPDGLRVVWTALAYGVFRLRASPSPERVESAIDQAFQQSPYLGR
jgi:hypothetical protein